MSTTVSARVTEVFFSFFQVFFSFSIYSGELAKYSVKGSQPVSDSFSVDSPLFFTTFLTTDPAATCRMILKVAYVNQRRPGWRMILPPGRHVKSCEAAFGWAGSGRAFEYACMFVGISALASRVRRLSTLKW